MRPQGYNPSAYATEAGGIPTDLSNIGLDYGNVAYTRRNRFLTTFLYELPFGKGKLLLNGMNGRFMRLKRWPQGKSGDRAAGLCPVSPEPPAVLRLSIPVENPHPNDFDWTGRCPFNRRDNLNDLTRLLCTLLLYSCTAQAEMRIASLNIAGKRGPKLLEEIRSQPDLRKADILLLQEVVDGSREHVADEIASALGFAVVFAPAFQLEPQYAEGLAILSRYPLGPAETIRLPRNDLHIGTTPRIALAATVEIPTGRLRVINTHLDDRINGALQRRQLEPIWEDARHFIGPCVIGGDFNTGNFLWGAHLFPAPGLQNQRAMVKQEMAKRGFTTPLGSGPATFHLPFFGLKLDWIYLRDLSVIGSGVTEIRFSDHNSVWVTIRVP
jgi:endonuclease/exonuclease/phosphatase family metal-dependent hydrolase